MVEIGATCRIFYWRQRRNDRTWRSNWAQTGWTPQPQPPQRLAAAKLRAYGEPEQGLRWLWCGVSGRRAIMVVFPAAAESPRERESLHTAPHRRRVGAALGWLMACLGVLLTKPDRNRTQMSLFFISECWQNMYLVFPASVRRQGGQEWAFHFFNSPQWRPNTNLFA